MLTAEIVTDLVRRGRGNAGEIEPRRYHANAKLREEAQRVLRDRVVDPGEAASVGEVRPDREQIRPLACPQLLNAGEIADAVRGVVEDPARAGAVLGIIHLRRTGQLDRDVAEPGIRQGLV